MSLITLFRASEEINNRNFLTCHMTLSLLESQNFLLIKKLWKLVSSRLPCSSAYIQGLFFFPRLLMPCAVLTSLYRPVFWKAPNVTELPFPSPSFPPVWKGLQLGTILKTQNRTLTGGGGCEARSGHVSLISWTWIESLLCQWKKPSSEPSGKSLTFWIWKLLWILPFLQDRTGLLAFPSNPLVPVYVH